MSRLIDPAAGTAAGSGPRTLIDVTTGVTLTAFSFDAEYARVSDPSKNTLTPLNNAGLEEAGETYLGLPSYQLGPTTAVSVETLGQIAALIWQQLSASK